MDKIEVTRPISDIERDILTTRTDATPVAWMYELPEASLRKFYNTRFPIKVPGWTEVPLYTHPPATDVAAQDDTALLEKLADEACKRLGIDPNEIVDPVGPVRKKDDIIYAMYAFAREKFWDTEPNDVAALVEAAKEVSDRAFMTYRRNGRDHYIEDDSGEGCMIVPHDAWSNLRQALAPFTKGQNDENA